LNKWEYSSRCLESLLSLEYRPLEICLVDNGSTDETPERLREFHEKAKAADVLIRQKFNDTNVGAATGRNHGMELASGDYIVFLDNDMVVRTRSWIEKMLAEFEAHPEVGAVCPKLLYPFEPLLIQNAGLVISPTGRADYVGRGKGHDDPEHNQRRELQAAISACLMIPRDVVEQVGEMDEQFNPVQFEDIDYCYRIRQLRRTVIYLPSVEMYHFENVTTDNTPGLGFKRQTVVNGMKFKRKWQHVFSKENGPPDSEMRWEEIPRVPLSEIGELETLP